MSLTLLRNEGQCVKIRGECGMLFATDWIKQRLFTGYHAALRFLDGLTFESVNDLFERNPRLALLLGLVAIALILTGFRTHKFISGFFGAAAMGYLGWSIAESFEMGFLSVNVLFTLIFSAIGFLALYFFYMIAFGFGIFCLSYILLRILFPCNMLQTIIFAGLITLVYALFLTHRHTIRTPIEGAALLELTVLRFISPLTAIPIFAVIVTAGIVIQTHMKKKYDQIQRDAANFRPNAPSPPTREEIEAERVEEEERRALAQKIIDRQSDIK